MNEILRYSNLIFLRKSYIQMLYQPVLKEIKQAFSLGSVSGSSTGLLTELYKAEKSFLAKYIRKWQTSLELLGAVIVVWNGLTVITYSDALVTWYSLLMLSLQHPFVLIYFSENCTGQFSGAVILLFVGESGTSRGRSWSLSVAQLFPGVGKSYKIERKSGGFQFSVLSNL